MQCTASRRLSLALASLITLAACGSDSDPTPPAPSVASIALSAASSDPLASIGDTRTITAVAKTASGATVGSPSVSWSSSAPTVATVVGSGTTATVTSVGNGSATITATAGAVQNTIAVVVAQRATSVGVSGASALLAPGARVQLTAEARDARQVAVSGVTGFTFSTSDQAVAVVSTSGLLTAITPGTASVSGSVIVNGVTVSGSAPLTVGFSAANPSTATVNATVGNQFTPSNVTISPGGTVTWAFASVTHNVQFRTGGAPAAIANSANVQVARTFPTAGSFDYDCTLHAGMVGRVVVQASGSTPAFSALLNGANERPNPVTTAGRGFASFTVSGGTVGYVVTFSGLSTAPTGAHIHGPGTANQAVGVLVDFPTAGQTVNNGVLTGSFTASNIRGAGGQAPISLDSLFSLMRVGNAYVNVHTPANPGGEIRGQIGVP